MPWTVPWAETLEMRARAPIKAVDLMTTDIFGTGEVMIK